MAGPVPGARRCLVVHHTDSERESACDRVTPVGPLDTALDEARARGRTIVDMKADWKRVSPSEKGWAEARGSPRS
jgi:hypothetical protein